MTEYQTATSVNQGWRSLAADNSVASMRRWLQQAQTQMQAQGQGQGQSHMTAVPMKELQRMKDILLLVQVHHPELYREYVQALDARDQMLGETGL